ncbi:hypothetical protein M885DRAFT_16588 [Pelagophyceae sp. CCMP2097]|nr:hypothetical protein M885DRAFT_16588 [Pelagophyceae sp. CCMP2097]
MPKLLGRLLGGPPRRSSGRVSSKGRTEGPCEVGRTMLQGPGPSQGPVSRTIQRRWKGWHGSNRASNLTTSNLPVCHGIYGPCAMPYGSGLARPRGLYKTRRAVQGPFSWALEVIALRTLIALRALMRARASRRLFRRCGTGVAFQGTLICGIVLQGPLPICKRGPENTL